MNLIDDLLKQHQQVIIWCASRISEFTNLREKWEEIKEKFTERESPGFLDRDSIILFLAKYKKLLNKEAESLIMRQSNVTAYYLVDIYRQLKRNKVLGNELLPQEVIAKVSLDVKEDNRKTFGGLDDIERLALKIISFLVITPLTLLESLILRSDPEKGKEIIASLLKKGVVYKAEEKLLIPNEKKIEVVCIFDSFKEFIYKQMVGLDKKLVIPGLLIAEAGDKGDEYYLSLLALMNEYINLDKKQKSQMKKIIFSRREDLITLWIASKLSEIDRDFLGVSDFAYKIEKEFDPDTLANFGHVFYIDKNYTNAIAFLEKALVLTSSNAKWLHELAHCYQAIGNLNSALFYMEKVTKEFNKYFYCLGILYSKLENHEMALTCYKKAIEQNENNTYAWNNLGVEYKNIGIREKAFDSWNTVLKIDPNKEESLKNLANHFFIIKDFEKSIEYCNRLLSINREDDETLDLLGQNLNELGRSREALIHLRKAIKLNPQKAGYYHNLSCTYHDLNNSGEAINFIRKAIRLNPEDAKHHNQLGYYYADTKDYENAIQNYDKALEKDPKYIEAYVNRGSAYFNGRNNYGTALKDFYTAISINKAHSMAHVCFGLVLFNLNEIKKSEREYELALALEPGKEKRAHPAASDKLKKVRKMLKDVKKNCAEIIGEKEEFELEFLNNSAYDAIMAGLSVEAEKILETGLHKDSNCYYLWATRGLLSFRKLEIAQGVELYEKAIRIDPDNLDLQRKFHYEYGMALRIKDKFDEAIIELERAMSISSNYVLNEQIEIEKWKAQKKDSSE